MLGLLVFDQVVMPGNFWLLSLMFHQYSKVIGVEMTLVPRLDLALSFLRVVINYCL